MRKFFLLIYMLMGCVLPVPASGVWQTHFAYTDVTRIAVTEDEVYGLSDGSLFAVNKQTERLRLLNLSTGLHATEVVCLGYSADAQTLLVLYANGKMDLLGRNGQITYVPDLYLEDMTASKRANSVSFHDGKAYLGMPFGILTFDIQKREFSDTYYVGREASEQNIRTIFFDNSRIYAATDSLLYSAPETANLVDYRDWTEQLLPTQGRLYNLLQAAQTERVDDGTCVWTAGGANGIGRLHLGETKYYKPDGPQSNNPHRMYYAGGRLYVVPGARWATQEWRPGTISYMDGGVWTNISNAELQAQAGADVTDLMNVAVWPDDRDHYVVTSYGTGAYEMRGRQMLAHWTTQNSSLQTAAPDADATYTRTDGAVFDSLGNLWMMNASGVVERYICIRRPNGEWTSMNVYPDGERFAFETPGEIVISNRADRWKWLVECRPSSKSPAGILLLDDNGTPTDASDDRCWRRSEWVDQEGLAVVPEYIYCAAQDDAGGLWVGTADGAFYITSPEAFMAGSACERVRLLQTDGTWLMDGAWITCIACDHRGRTWIGTQTQGVYVIGADRRSVEMHLLPGETPMPSASVLSLAIDRETETYYIGTGAGIVSYREGETAVQGNAFAPMETSEASEDSGTMGSWTLHFAYQDVTSVAVSDRKVYGVSEGALMAVDLEDELVEKLNRLNGLSDAGVAKIAYCEGAGELLVMYENGNMDLLNDEGDVWNIGDLKQKQLSGKSKVANSVCSNGRDVYMAMSFGVMKLNLRKHEIAETFYIGDASADVNVDGVGVVGDSLYASSGNRLYAAKLTDNLVDYHVWTQRVLPATGAVSEALTPARTDTVAKGGETFIAAGEDGIVRLRRDGSRQTYVPNGPATNMPYALSVEGERLIAVPGGAWALQYKRPGNVMIYDKGEWFNSLHSSIQAAMGDRPALDFMNAAIDPTDVRHFFVSSYGTGLYEYREDRLYMHYSWFNTPNGLEKAAADAAGDWYTRVNGAVVDQEGNVWMMNAGSYPNNVCILAPDGSWRSFNIMNRGTRVVIETPGQIVIDRNRPNYKWVASMRASSSSSVGLALIDDNGTPLEHGDDRTVFYQSFVDQFGSTVTPDEIYCISQDEEGDLWVGTNEGVFSIPSGQDYFSSNACKRYKINRTDGSGLADFLLSTEVVKAIVHDGGNRHWIGTAGNGVYLVHYKDYWDAATVHHFTTANSPLPSDNILSLAILPTTGEVFIGTESGLASFRSDATPGAEDMSGAMVWPNPVRPDYEGNITVSGLMADTYVKVTDAAGGLVYSTRSNGGTAVWDGRNGRGARVAPGVYKVYCNTAEGEHVVLNLLVMR